MGPTRCRVLAPMRHGRRAQVYVRSCHLHTGAELPRQGSRLDVDRLQRHRDAALRGSSREAQAGQRDARHVFRQAASEPEDAPHHRKRGLAALSSFRAQHKKRGHCQCRHCHGPCAGGECTSADAPDGAVRGLEYVKRVGGGTDDVALPLKAGASAFVDALAPPQWRLCRVCLVRACRITLRAAG